MEVAWAPSSESTQFSPVTNAGRTVCSPAWWSKTITSIPSRPQRGPSSPRREQSAVSTMISRRTDPTSSERSVRSGRLSPWSVANSRTFGFIEPVKTMWPSG